MNKYYIICSALFMLQQLFQLQGKGGVIKFIMMTSETIVYSPCEGLIIHGKHYPYS